MNITEKKQRIIDEISNSNDESLISEMYDLLEADDTIRSIEPKEMTRELQIKLFRAREDYRQGRYITHEQIKEKIQQWLTR